MSVKPRTSDPRAEGALIWPSHKLTRSKALIVGQRSPLEKATIRTPYFPATLCRPLVQYIADSDGAGRRTGPITGMGSFLKRSMDVFVSSLALLFLWPLMLLIAIAVKLESRGPVIYRSLRVGKDGREFNCYKFRTMIAGSDGLKQNLRRLNQRRFTRCGVGFRVRIGKPGNPLFSVAPPRLGGGQVQALGHGCAAFSPVSSHRPLGRILIRKQIQGCIINSWLVLIAVLGTVIVVADGLTRTPVLDTDAYWNGPLEYQPYLGAVLLAGLTLALMFGYVRRAGISVTEGLLLWFVFCTTAYTRDFSYIHLPRTPLFVTGIVFVLLFLSIPILASS